MPGKKGSVVIVLGPPGSGKTTITKELLLLTPGAFNVNKDILAESISVKNPCDHTHAAQIDEESLYTTLLQQVAYNMRAGQPGATAIIEGNFGKRLTVGMLQTAFTDLDLYDFFLVHIVCNNIEEQFNRVCQRNADKDKAIAMNGIKYNLTARDDFERYRALRMEEEGVCIQTMSDYMRIITLDNSKPCISSNSLKMLARDLKRKIEPHNIPKVVSLPVFPIPLGVPNYSQDYSPEIKPITCSEMIELQTISPLQNKKMYNQQLPFLSLWGRHRKKPDETYNLYETFNKAGRKSPRLSNIESDKNPINKSNVTFHMS